MNTLAEEDRRPCAAEETDTGDGADNKKSHTSENPATCFFGFGAEVMPGRRLPVQRPEDGDAPVVGVDSKGPRGVALPVDGISANNKAEKTLLQPWGR